ncbi:glycosyltransferase family 9 protein [Cyanobium sp. WAJ14-Wanaka]|nr:glycosyltransferase family 9 protein [Cyanobium sp. WAJ14-Wanaka]
MQRYGGEELGEAPHIVVLGSCKVGNFVVSTPVLRGLKARFPKAVLGFVGSELTADFEAALDAIDWRLSWDDPAPGAGLRLQQELAQLQQRHGPVQLAVNLDGFNPVTCSLVPWLNPCFVAGGSLTANLRRQLPWGELPQQHFLADPEWDSPAFLDRYRGVFASNYIAELFCRLAFVADYADPTAIELPASDPPFEVPELLIHCTTARGAKLWPFSHWRQVVEFATGRGWRVGLVGSPPAAQREAYNAGDGEEDLLASTGLEDLRGRTSLMELAGAAQRARAVISVDAGPLHIAAAVGTPTLAVVGNDGAGVGASPVRLWLPRCENVSRTTAMASCSACSDNRFRNDDCLVDGHPCMASVGPEQVIGWLEGVMG